MKENRQIALYVACGDLEKVKIEEQELKIEVEESTIYALLKDGQREIERALSWQGIDLKVNIQFKEKIISKTQQDIEKLKGIFKEKLKIKGE